jgi:cytidylate kinase
MPLTIALWGESGSGKSSVSNRLANYFGGNVILRHCGELLKGRATELGCTPDEIAVNKEENERLDTETRQFASKNTGIAIVEGRFLNTVLSGMSNVLFVKMECSEEVLAFRKQQRSESSSISESMIEQTPDCTIILSNSKDICGHGMQIQIDTNALSIDAVAERIFCYATNHT